MKMKIGIGKEITTTNCIKKQKVVIYINGMMIIITIIIWLKKNNE